MDSVLKLLVRFARWHNVERIALAYPRACASCGHAAPLRVEEIEQTMVS